MFSKLVRRILMLTVLTTGLALSSSELVGNTAGAVTCCSQCIDNYGACLNACSTQACIDKCDTVFGHCYLLCDPNC